MLLFGNKTFKNRNFHNKESEIMNLEKRVLPP